MSKRKPFRDCAGYIASRINPLTNVHNVIYVASGQGIDVSTKYITVCEAHHETIGSTSVPKARIDMKDAREWCSSCKRLAGNVS